MTKKDLALGEALRLHNRAADGRTEFTPDHLRVLADFCASQDPNFNREQWIDYVVGECDKGSPKRKLVALDQGKLKALKLRRERPDRLKTLRRLITACAWCKRIRYSEGVWQQPQSDVQAHKGAKFSHGICPACADSVRALTQPVA